MSDVHKRFTVLDLPRLIWPTTLRLPTKRFRLLLAAGSANQTVDALSHFALAALDAGMVYFCVWGSGCERFHDVVDECIVEDEIGPRRFAHSGGHDQVMTAWHPHDTLEEAVDFLARFAVPNDRFLAESDFRLVLTVGHPEWCETAKWCLEAAEFSV